jgi:hypothetical protein
MDTNKQIGGKIMSAEEKTVKGIKFANCDDCRFYMAAFRQCTNLDKFHLGKNNYCLSPQPRGNKE